MMTAITLFDPKRMMMEVRWKEGDTTAKYRSDKLKKQIGWNLHTTNTLIRRCIKKNAYVTADQLVKLNERAGALGGDGV